MNILCRYGFKLTSGLLLLSLLGAITPAMADFGLGGIEFSPVRTFASANSDNYSTYSGTVNFELNNPSTELAIPFLWSKTSATSLDNDAHESLVMELQWRKFDKPSRNGGYVGLLLRGVSAEDRSSDIHQRATDIGVGVVAGFRRNISSGFYWGANASLVAFADEPTINLGEEALFRRQVSMTFDFLKIGYQF